MKKKLFLYFLVLLVHTAHCQLVSDSVLIEGHYRTFHFLAPADKQSSLLFVLHGSGGNGRRMRSGAQKLEAIAPNENILMVYPDGYKNYWNECRKTPQSPANM